MTAARLVLVLGASGYVGGRVVPELLAAGHRVRCLARSPEKLRDRPWVGRAEVVRGDLLEPATLSAAFAGADAALYLVHSMGSPAHPGDRFAEADRTAARNVARAAADAGTRRLVYLGGLGETDERTSAHLRSRAEVGRILLDCPVPTTVLRAAVIIGSGSASFEMLRHLVDKLPVMVTPRWVDTRVQPIAIRDVLRYLVGVIDPGDDADHVHDIGGPDVLTYLEMMRVYARVAGLPRRLVVKVPVLTPRLSSYWVNLVTPVPFRLAKPLVLSLSNEVVVRAGEDIGAVVPGPCLPYPDALRLALARIRDREVETSWTGAELRGRSPAEPYPGDPAWAGGTLLSDVRAREAAASPAQAFAAVCRVGGERGWPAHMWAWWLRGLLDRLIGGAGLRRGRRHPDRLRIGDALDFWRVEDLREPDADAGGTLRLRAEMRLPGRAWLEYRIDARSSRRAGAEAGAIITQRALFAPRGLLGRAYWWTLQPFHRPIFATTVARLAEDAERLAAGERPVWVTGGGGATAPPAGLVDLGGPPARRRRGPPA